MKLESDEEIANIAEMVEARAYADWIRSAPPKLIDEYRAYVGKIGSLAIMFTIPKVDWLTPNRVFGLGLFEPATEHMVDEIVRICNEKGTRRFFVTLCPFVKPSFDSIKGWLESRRFQLYNNWVRFYRSAKVPLTPAHTDFEIRTIDRTYANDFAKTIISAFPYPENFSPWLEFLVGRPGWRHYLAFDGKKPVATGALLVEEKIGYLCLGSTQPTHRRRGAQEVMINQRIQDGVRLGCEWFFVETVEDTPENPNPSYHNMLRAGFKRSYLRPNFVLDLAK